MKNLFTALLLGIVLGAAGLWFIEQSLVKQARQGAEQKAVAAGAVASAAEDMKRSMAAKLEAMELRADQIRAELQQTGKVVRRKAREVGEAAVDAAVDTRITAEVKRKLAVDPDLSFFAISVDTTGGHVTLSGTAASPELIGKAILLAMEVEGVRDVASTLQVK